MAVELFGTSNSSTEYNVLHHEHDFIIPQIVDYEKRSPYIECITCETSYCILCGKILNNSDTYCTIQKIDKVLHEEIWSQECK
jgi:hypothetical protein